MAGDWDELDSDPNPVVPAPDPSPATLVKGSRAAQIERIREIEDDIFLRALELTGDVINFADVAEDAVAPPQEWVDTLGPEVAQRRFRHAMAAWKNSREAPVGITLGVNTARGIAKARAMERAAPKALAIIMMPGPGVRPEDAMEIIDVDSD